MKVVHFNLHYLTPDIDHHYTGGFCGIQCRQMKWKWCWGIRDKIYVGATDNVRNAIVDIIKLHHLGCVGHTLQLSVNKLNLVARLLGRVKKLFKRSTKDEKQILLIHHNMNWYSNVTLGGTPHCTCFNMSRNNSQLCVMCYLKTEANYIYISCLFSISWWVRMESFRGSYGCSGAIWRSYQGYEWLNN